MVASQAPMGACSTVRLVSHFIFPALESGLRWYRSDGVGRDCRSVMSSRPEIQHAARRHLIPRALFDFSARLEMVGAGLYRAGLEPQGSQRNRDLWFANRGIDVWIFVRPRMDGHI